VAVIRISVPTGPDYRSTLNSKSGRLRFLAEHQKSQTSRYRSAELRQYKSSCWSTLELSRTLNTMPSIQTIRVEQVPRGRSAGYRYRTDTTFRILEYGRRWRHSKLWPALILLLDIACCFIPLGIRSVHNVEDPVDHVPRFGHFHLWVERSFPVLLEPVYPEPPKGAVAFFLAWPVTEVAMPLDFGVFHNQMNPSTLVL